MNNLEMTSYQEDETPLIKPHDTLRIPTTKFTIHDPRSLPRFSSFLKLVFSHRYVCGLAIGMLSSAALGEILVFTQGSYGSKFIEYLLAKDAEKFGRLVAIVFGILVVEAIINGGIKRWLKGALAIEFRKIVTRELHRVYAEPGVLYATAREPEIVLTNLQKPWCGKWEQFEQGHQIHDPSTVVLDNPDQRITQDTGKMCVLMASLLQDLVLTPFTVLWYTWSVWSIVGWEGVAIIYAHYILGGLLSWTFARTVVPAVLAQQNVEGDFRFIHVHARTSAEQVAMARGESREHSIMDQILADLKRAMLRTVNRESVLGVVTALVTYVGAILSYCIAAIPIFIKHKYDDLPPTELSQIISMNTFVCMYLSSRLNYIVAVMGEMSEAAGFMGRVGLLWEYCEIIKDVLPHHSLEETDLVAEVKGATIVTPGKFDTDEEPGTVLMENVDLKIFPDDKIVLCGSNGTGKSSLLRVLAGIWHVYRGKVAIGKKVEPMFLPTTPHLPLATFKGLIAYPENGDDLNDVELIEILAKVRLDKRGGDEVRMPSEWSRMFSTGELQKLGLARALYWIKRREDRGIETFMFLDESLANMDMGGEYEVLNEVFGDRVRGWLRISHHFKEGDPERILRVKNGRVYENLET